MIKIEHLISHDKELIFVLSNGDIGSAKNVNELANYISEENEKIKRKRLEKINNVKRS